ncbi:MAG: GntR family transcriptional regulator [Planctomycetes bacterium]|nr:GntR family transcriptional regulator [Planctomycetota bacterium]
MQIHLDPRSAEPIFEQIAYAVKSALATGAAAEGDRLPSVRELARELAINPNTVVRAYEALEREGVVVRRQGAGCFLTGRGSELAAAGRRRQLQELLRRAATEAFHLGFSADDVRRALDQSLERLDFDRQRKATP